MKTLLVSAQCFSVSVFPLLSLIHQSAAELTLKVDLLHDVLGLHALLLVEDEDLSFVVLCPAVLVHPDFHLRVCNNTDRRSFIYINSFSQGLNQLYCKC